MDLKAFDSLKDLDAGAGLTLPQDECVVDKTVATVCFSGAIAAHARHARTLRGVMLENVADHIGVFTRYPSETFLLPCGSGPINSISREAA